MNECDKSGTQLSRDYLGNWEINIKKKERKKNLNAKEKGSKFREDKLMYKIKRGKGKMCVCVCVCTAVQ